MNCLHSTLTKVLKNYQQQLKRLELVLVHQIPHHDYQQPDKDMAIRQLYLLNRDKALAKQAANIVNINVQYDEDETGHPIDGNSPNPEPDQRWYRL